MDAAQLNNEQLAFVAARTFGRLWMPRSTRESLQPFQTFCYELLRSTQIAMPIVMLTLLYVHKFKQRFPGLHGGSGSEYRVFVVALMLASKYLEDNTFTTQTWSDVSHLPARELAIMQREFLVALDHRLHVPEAEFNAWINRLQTIVVGEPSSAGKGNNAFSLVAPQQALAEVSSPSDFQVVPSPASSLHHEILPMDFMPSPPAKRTRPSLPSIAYPKYYVPGSGSGSLHAVRARTMVEPLNLSTHSVAAAPQMYTPPTAGVGFANSEFTFKAPTFSVSSYPSGPFYSTTPQQQQQPSIMYSASMMNQLAAAASIPSANMVTSAFQPVSIPPTTAAPLAFGQSDRLSIHGAALQQQHFGTNANNYMRYSAGFFDRTNTNVPGNNANSGCHGFAQQQPASMPAAVAAFAAQYPFLYYNNAASSFGLGSARTHSFPIYTYGV
ncbi:hypothetical protein GGI23_006249 [Coemansia sp. RSA 2559]|nr:hypothetical protein GGI23_006249 [Coemansia sp. RSA 2559]